MKKLTCFLLLALMVALPAAAQADLSGTAEIGFSANIPESDDYYSLLNPDNVMELEDFSMSTSLTARLDAGDEKTTFSAWFSLNQYPIGWTLIGVGIPESAVEELSAFVGDSIVSFNVMRFSANVYLGDYISMEVGRQSMLTGYGYGWNPIDFANPLKDPSDPDAALRGVDALSFQADLGYIASLKLYGILPDDILVYGVDFEEIKGGGELTFFFTGIELKLAGFYDYDAALGSDAYTPSLGAGFMIDLFGMGLYSEAAVRKGSRNYFTDGTAYGLSKKDDWLFSVLAGLEYTFPNELYAVVEYFYNGEGFNKTERTRIEDALNDPVLVFGPTSDLMAMYSPGYFSRHYVMVNLMQPLYDINTNLNLSAIFSPDSGSLTVLPSISYNFSGNFSGRIDYVGMFDLYDDDFSEVSAMPVHHVIQTVFTYSY